MSQQPKDTPQDPSDESIGRPGPWQESRHQKPGAPARDSVVRKPGEGPPDTLSTPVTREDYEGPGREASRVAQRL
jgi:hypothetical protein